MKTEKQKSSRTKTAVGLRRLLGNTVTIFYKQLANEFLWAWEESRNKNVWGKAKTKKEIITRAKKMFNVENIILQIV